MSKLINPDLLGNWENWTRVFLIVAIGAAMLHFALRFKNSKKG